MEKEQKDAMVMCSLILLRNSGYLLFDLLIAWTCRIQNIRLRFGWISRFEFLFFFKGCLLLAFAKAIFQVPTRYINQKSKTPGVVFPPTPTLVRLGESWDSVQVVGDGSSTIRQSSEVWVALVLLGT